MRTRVKVCGMRRLSDVLVASRLGVDAIGLVFYPSSPRYIEVDQASELTDSCPPFVDVVALFRDAPANEIERVIEEVGVDYLQFHGNETEDFCASFGIPYIKAIPMGGSDTEYQATMDAFIDSAHALLFDSHSDSKAGGSGETFDWQKVPYDMDIPIIIAGGLNATNVGQVIADIEPYAVDISSGVEVEKGIKDKDLMRDFIQSVQIADEQKEKSDADLA